MKEPFDMILQLFADDAGAEGAGAANPANDAGQPSAAQTNPSPTTDRPTFDAMLSQGYQAEFDRRVAKAIETAKGKFTDPRVSQLQTQLDDYIRRDAVVRANVDPRFAKFVTSEVAASLGEGDSFENKLADYLKDNSQFLRADPAAKPAAWSQSLQGGKDDSAGTDGVMEAFKRLNPDLKYN